MIPWAATGPGSEGAVPRVIVPQSDQVLCVPAHASTMRLAAAAAAAALWRPLSSAAGLLLLMLRCGAALRSRLRCCRCVRASCLLLPVDCCPVPGAGVCLQLGGGLLAMGPQLLLLLCLMLLHLLLLLLLLETCAGACQK